MCFRNDRCRHNSEMEPQQGRTASPLRRRRLRPHGLRKTTLSNGRAECREKIGIAPKESCFLLTFPLIGLFRKPFFPILPGHEGLVLRNGHFVVPSILWAQEHARCDLTSQPRLMGLGIWLFPKRRRTAVGTHGVWWCELRDSRCRPINHLAARPHFGAGCLKK